MSLANKLPGKRLLLAGLLAGLAGSGAMTAAEWPDFQEVLSLVRSNLTGLSEAELNRAALHGLLQQLPAQALLLTNAPGAPSDAPTPAGPGLSSTNLYDEAYAYVRVARVEGDLGVRLGEALGQLGGAHPLRGLVLDLRYATGQDYAAAAQAADRFLTAERLLLDWGGAAARSTSKTNAFTRPVAILVNRQTAAAAEALAAILRQAEVGLLIGARTAGQASIFKEFPLRGGYRLRLATAPVSLGDGKAIPVSGLPPDIAVTVDPEDEKQHFADAYKTFAKSTPILAGRGASNVAATASNRAARLNEAELVRMKREGLSLDGDPVPPTGRVAAAEKPTVTDPALARALDLLKGLAVVHQARPL